MVSNIASQIQLEPLQFGVVSGHAAAGVYTAGDGCHAAGEAHTRVDGSVVGRRWRSKL